MGKNNMQNVIIISFIYLLLSVSGMFFIKLGHMSKTLFYIPLINISISAQLLLGVLLYAFGFLVFVFFVSRFSISKIIPIVSGIYCCFTVIIGIAYFGEKITLGQLIGMVMVIIGTVMVGIFK